MENSKNIELRSEKVQKVVGEMPSVLLRYGIAIIGIVLLLIIATAAYIPYKETVDLHAVVKTFPESNIIYSMKTGNIILIEEGKKQINKNEVIAHQITKDSVYAYCAPISGRLFSVVRQNDNVRQGALLFIITPIEVNKYYAFADISKALLSKIKEGQKVLFRNCPIKLEGIVTNIYPDLSIDKETVRIRIDFSQKLSVKLPAEYRINGEIFISNKSFLQRFWETLKMI